jgi:hypothetical protein
MSNLLKQLLGQYAGAWREHLLAIYDYSISSFAIPLPKQRTHVSGLGSLYSNCFQQKLAVVV